MKKTINEISIGALPKKWHSDPRYSEGNKICLISKFGLALIFLK